MNDAWSFRDGTDLTHSLDGYQVEALDGRVGRVGHASTRPRSAYLVVDSGRLRHHRRIVPAGVVDWTDHRERRVHLRMTKHELRVAPALTEVGDGQHDPSAVYFENYLA